jgi:glycosyltransferase involved in cell wall biosynthesis
MTEGLPNAVCEAMLCECIPVGSAVGGIPAAVGSSGFLLRTRDADEAARLIRQALNAPSSLGKSARRRAVQLFRMELRERAIVNRIRSLRPGLSGKP